MTLAIDQVRLEASSLLDAKRRSELGQYMTPSGVAWETEVWCASDPTHLIHFNGIRFLGPYAK